ncbi:hypothetical protein EDB87DRAFT_456836 [Lactarius vividus]|nr:hypothetical protein EDB87DRAFT_456836 [Lactarius vividus]
MFHQHMMPTHQTVCWATHRTGTARNANVRQTIKRRLRASFRSYNDIRRVICHELMHPWGSHSNNFKELNSKLNREVGESGQRTCDSEHTLTRYRMHSWVPRSGKSRKYWTTV